MLFLTVYYITARSAEKNAVLEEAVGLEEDEDLEKDEEFGEAAVAEEDVEQVVVQVC